MSRPYFPFEFHLCIAQVQLGSPIQSTCTCEARPNQALKDEGTRFTQPSWEILTAVFLSLLKHLQLLENHKHPLHASLHVLLDLNVEVLPQWEREPNEQFSPFHGG